LADTRPIPRSVTRSDVASLAVSLTRAFAREPLHQWMVPDPKSWATKAPRYFSSYINIIRRDGFADTVDGLQGSALWLSPHKPGGSFLSRISVPFVIWRLTGSRFTQVWNALPQLDQQRPKTPHWYLDMLGVAPEASGQGIGAQLLRHGLARCDRTGEAVFLQTLSEEMIAYYHNYGFEVSGTFAVPSGPSGWSMTRPSQA
jgi:GNAT superfamily N-acetyltransferase